MDDKGSTTIYLKDEYNKNYLIFEMNQIRTAKAQTIIQIVIHFLGTSSGWSFGYLYRLSSGTTEFCTIIIRGSISVGDSAMSSELADDIRRRSSPISGSTEKIGTRINRNIWFI